MERGSCTVLAIHSSDLVGLGFVGSDDPNAVRYLDPVRVTKVIEVVEDKQPRSLHTPKRGAARVLLE
jgi:hypothetical protein